MPRILGFPPVAGPNSRVMILGSMPGAASLAAGEYYAHPRNAFWPVLGRLLEMDPAAPYADRIQVLLREGLAVWDVLKSCKREGSLDSSIQAGSLMVNDFSAFLRGYPLVRNICFNGTTAETLFRKRVAQGLGPMLEGVGLFRLPSTSPAHASLSLARKTEMWRGVLTPLLA